MNVHAEISIMDIPKSFKIENLEELKNWLEENYNSKDSIWLVFPKKTSGANFAWSEIVDVLLCYGWIDSVARKVDENYTSIRISPRNQKSFWSKINKDKVAILEAKKLIHPNGLKTIEIAKQTGTWTALDDVENLVLPKDLEEYLTQNNLLEAWNMKPKSFKRGFLEQLLNTKKAESRLKKMQSLKI
jgi:uncharacterized protein YdeI (YjbR/CyaY-like superfamily)